MKKQLSKKDAAGMTVDERLYLNGLLDDFDRALAARDRQALKAILEQVHVDSESADAVIKQLFEE